MNIQFEEKKNILIASLVGELDHHSAAEVRSKIDDRLEKTNYKNLILNFYGVTFMDSSGIGVVIGRYKKLNMKKGKVSITNVNESVKRVFELSGLFKIIGLYDNVENAVKDI